MELTRKAQARLAARRLIGKHKLGPAPGCTYGKVAIKRILHNSNGQSGFRFMGRNWHLDEIMRTNGSNWHGAQADTYFSGVLVRISDDCESVLVAYQYC